MLKARQPSSSGLAPSPAVGNGTSGTTLPSDRRLRKKKKKVRSTSRHDDDDDDDGGSDKSSSRKRRRGERKQYPYALLFSLALGFVFLLFTRRREHRKLDAWRRFQRAKAMQGLMEERSGNGRQTQGPGRVRGGREQREDADGHAIQLHRLGRPLKRSPPQSQPGGKTLGPKTKQKRHKWINPKVLPPIPGKKDEMDVNPLFDPNTSKKFIAVSMDQRKLFRAKKKGRAVEDWELEATEAEGPVGSDGAAAAAAKGNEYHGTGVDYTAHSYRYPELIPGPPADGTYPPMERLGDMLKRWPQDALDDPPSPLVERLMHFDYAKPEELEMARKYRDAELPFKVYNVPEIQRANEKWSDDYVSMQFDGPTGKAKLWDVLRGKKTNGPKSHGTCQESRDNFFAFFTREHWDVKLFGDPPTLDVDFSYAKWSRHARHADRVRLTPSERHFYWQSGVPREERKLRPEAWTFVSRDLPSWSSNEETFFSFHPEEQKGIQCRFGERGVTAATHYDAGRNMVAMVVGAKRYILSPPNACSRLGIVNTRGHPTFRHSLLNFAHLDLLRREKAATDDAEGMPKEEKEWLERAYESRAVDTVLKAGEVLYIPSHWFHYITSLQKSAQCNVRSGREKDGTPAFGGFKDVIECDGD